jgi:hypothetical protein
VLGPLDLHFALTNLTRKISYFPFIMDVAQSKFATIYILHACEEVEKRGASGLDTNIFKNNVRASLTANEDTLTTCGLLKRGP